MGVGVGVFVDVGEGSISGPAPKELALTHKGGVLL